MLVELEEVRDSALVDDVMHGLVLWAREVRRVADVLPKLVIWRYAGNTD